MEAEAAVMCPQAKEHQGTPRKYQEPLEARRGKDFPYSFQREHSPANPLILDF